LPRSRKTVHAMLGAPGDLQDLLGLPALAVLSRSARKDQ
jgi:hypothetical protein